MISLILYLQKVSAYTFKSLINAKSYYCYYIYLLFQLDKVGRRRRNEFEDFVHYKPNINSILMKFDKQDLLGDSALYENNFHVVQEATLTIKLIRSSAKEIMTPLLNSPLTFTLYQVITNK